MDVDLVVEMPTSPAEAELVADRLWSSGATAVELRDRPAAAGPDAGQPPSRSNGMQPPVTVAASFPTPTAARRVAGELAHLGARLVEVDPSWRDVWRRYAEPVEVGESLVVAPEWREVGPAWREVAVAATADSPTGDSPTAGRTAVRVVARIDPGNCFGSGSHPSTRFILSALASEPAAPADRVLDVGCGSGILAVAAAMLGAEQVVAVDIDPAAVEATRSNASANGVADRVETSTTPVDEVRGEYDLVLVNVTAGVHAVLGPSVVARTRPGGRVLVGGLLPGQWRHVAPAYEGLTVVAGHDLDGWEGFELHRPT